MLLSTLVSLSVAAGCSQAPMSVPASPSASTRTSPTASLSGTVTVLAAASLTTPFTALAAEFEKEHPGVDVQFSFGSSTTLAQQIAQGAPADLFASAGTKALDQLPAGVATATTVTLARNVLEIATPAGNAKAVTGLASLANPDLAVVLCAATVPCGSAADAILATAGVSAHVVSREVDVKATLAKVTLGEADAAVVYHSDVVGAGSKVTGVEIPASANTTLAYPMVTLSSDPATTAFAAYLSGPDGVRALTESGFLAP